MPMNTRIINFSLGVVCLLAALFMPNGAKAEDKVLEIRGYIDTHTLDKKVFLIQNMTEEDNLTLVIDSPGGRVDSGIALCKAITESKVNRVVAYIPKNAASTAAEIASCTDTIVMEPKARIMFHLGSITDESTHKVITLTKYTDLSSLPAYERAYVEDNIRFNSYVLSHLGVDQKHIDIALSSENGLEIEGWKFKQIHPSMNGLRKDPVYKKLYMKLGEL